MYRKSNKYDVIEKRQYHMMHDTDRYNSPYIGWWPCVGCHAIKPTPCGLCRRCNRYWSDMDSKIERKRTVRQYYKYLTDHILDEDFMIFR